MDPPLRSAWDDLGVVGTIYEEEEEDDEEVEEEEDEDGGGGGSSTISSFSPVLSPSPTPLRSRIEAWSVAMGHETDVIIRIQSSSFHLHKDPLTARSGYLKRHLKELAELTLSPPKNQKKRELTLSPPLKITAESFTLVADFCYGTHIVVTPFNVGALRVAADLLEMTEAEGDENLRQRTEAYFRHAVTVNREYTSIVLRSCLTLLPEAETTASLVSRCIDALNLMGEGDGVISCLKDVKTLRAEDFQLIVESLNQRLTGSHDLLYRIVDLSFKEHSEEMTEEQKTRMCNYIDCTILSPLSLMHAVQNPRMPLRFVVQAMFVEQLNTRRSILSAADYQNQYHNANNYKYDQSSKKAATLGAILQRDAALRQVAQLRAAMSATSSRIQSLEEELSGMRKLLQESENCRSRGRRIVVDSGRSVSSRFSSESDGRIIGRGQTGSVSSASFRIITDNKKNRGSGFSSSSEGSYDETPSPREGKNFGRRLMNGLKSALKVSAFGSGAVSKRKPELQSPTTVIRSTKGDEEEDFRVENHGNGDVIVIKKSLPFHRRSRSHSQL